jgi:hypothetical protein
MKGRRGGGPFTVHHFPIVIWKANVPSIFSRQFTDDVGGDSYKEGRGAEHLLPCLGHKERKTTREEPP